jgi:hypothetical protein
LITLARIAFASFGPNHPLHHVTEPALALLRPVREGQPRVVWMIFDEMDQRLTFEQRPATLQMPEIDRLRREFLCATNAYPPGENTIESVPGLLTGRRISAASPKNASDLALTLADTGQVVAWSELPTVFDSARELGVNTALVGWFHPYRRVVNRSLSYCAWYPTPKYQSVRALNVGEAMSNELQSLLGNFRLRRQFADICRATLADSLSVVTNAAYGLVFLHLPPPHLPGVFNPATGRFTYWDMSRVPTYFHNLALADRTLGQLRQAMQASGQWDKTWVILSADHSWRESRLYDGRRDLRVPFIIKAPGAAQSLTCSTPINTCLTHDLALAILRGDLTNQLQTFAWLNARPSPKPAVEPDSSTE